MSRNGGIAPLVHNLGTRRRTVIGFATRLLYPCKKKPPPPVPNKQMLGGPPNQCGSFKEKNLLPILETKPQTVQPTA